jgi:hypothetical protein
LTHYIHANPAAIHDDFGDAPGRRDDSLLELINDLIGQSNDNYLQTLLASAKRDGQEAWDRFNEGFELDETIDKLLLLHWMSGLSGSQRHKAVQ